MVGSKESTTLVPSFRFGTSVLNSEPRPSAQRECYAALETAYQVLQERHHGQISILQPLMDYSIPENLLVDERSIREKVDRAELSHSLRESDHQSPCEM